MKSSPVNLPLLDMMELDETVWQRLGRTGRWDIKVLLLQPPPPRVDPSTFQSSCSILRTTRPSSDCSFSLSLARDARSSHTLVSSLEAQGQSLKAPHTSKPKDERVQVYRWVE